jgi:hypothetical protein
MMEEEKETEKETTTRTLRDRKAPRVIADKGTLRDGYKAFAASESEDTKSGTMTTTAILTADGSEYTGNSGKGHAEMDALNQMLVANGKNLAALLELDGKTVTCTAKPCCYRCSVVLGLLGFAPSSAETKKTASGMGSTQWALPDPLGSVLKAKYGDIQTLLSSFSNAGKL